ncbi:MAG TPA: hypothetical protein DGO43_00155 [Chloroflexi bacterium]|nr:hypothetical protein [Chloroflexota bacterium]|tara:strand:- start:70 stop:1272 length:1203 start_codon:yes stop_codon:yes gene_type:complete
MIDDGRRGIFFASTWFYVAFGVALSVVGPAVEAIRDEFNVSYADLGFSFTTWGVGFIFGSLVGGTASDRWGRRSTLLLTAAAGALALAWLGVSRGFAVFLVACLFSGMALGSGDGTVSALIADAFPQETGRALNLVHIAVALGAILGPAVVAATLAVFDSWRLAIVGGAVLMATSVVPFSLLRYPARSSEAVAWPEIGRAMADPVPLSLGIVLAFYVGAEIGFAGFGAAFIEQTFHIERGISAVSISVFWIGQMVGRVIAARLADRWAVERMVRWALVSGILVSILCAVGPTVHVVLLGYLLSGTVLAAVFPTVLGIGFVRRPHIAGVVAGVVVAFAGIGSSAFGPAIGWITDVFGFRAGMLLVPIFLVGALLVFQVAWRIRPHNNGPGQNEESQRMFSG